MCVIEEIAARRRQQRVENAIFGSVVGAHTHAAHGLFTSALDGDLDQVTDDRLDIAAHVSDLGELGRFDLDERSIGQACQAASNFGLAHAGRSDQQDVLRGNLLPQGLRHLRTPPTTAQRDGHGLLGLALTDDMFVKFANDFLRGHRRHDYSSTSMVKF